MICPLCHTELQPKVPPQKGFSCPTQIKDFSGSKPTKSHYSINSFGDKYIYVDQFRVNESGADHCIIPEHDHCFRIYKVKPDFKPIPGHINVAYGTALTVPKFEIKSSEQLLNKIKTLLTFS